MVLGIEAEPPTASEDDMAKKNSKKKAAAKSKPPKKTAPAKRTAKAEELVVFAFRLTEAERDLIHKTAGPARASRYVRRIAAAFAKQDEGSFRAVLKEARETRSA